MNKIKKGDIVKVETGKDKGKTGKVLSVIATEKGNKVVVEGVNIATIAKKARKQNEKSEIVKVEKAIDASNVMMICPTCNETIRVKFDIVNGKKVRVCRKCGATLPEETYVSKKVAPKKTRRKKKEETNENKKVEK